MSCNLNRGVGRFSDGTASRSLPSVATILEATASGGLVLPDWRRQPDAWQREWRCRERAIARITREYLLDQPMRAIVPEYAVYFRRLLPFLDWAKENHPVISVDRAIANWAKGYGGRIGVLLYCAPCFTVVEIQVGNGLPPEVVDDGLLRCIACGEGLRDEGQNVGAIALVTCTPSELSIRQISRPEELDRLRQEWNARLTLFQLACVA